MPRTRHGWLKATALKAGVPEQAAREVDRVRHTVELRWDAEAAGFVTSYLIANVDDERDYERHEWQYALDLPAAREKFAECEKRIDEIDRRWRA